jgi:hypothetical protein
MNRTQLIERSQELYELRRRLMSCINAKLTLKQMNRWHLLGGSLDQLELVTKSKLIIGWRDRVQRIDAERLPLRRRLTLQLVVGG